MIKFKLKKYKDGSGILCIGTKEVLSFSNDGEKYELLCEEKYNKQFLTDCCSKIKYTYEPSVYNLINFICKLEIVKNNIKKFKDSDNPDDKQRDGRFHLFHIGKVFRKDLNKNGYATFASRKFTTNTKNGERVITQVDSAHSKQAFIEWLTQNDAELLEDYITFETKEDIDSWLTISDDVDNKELKTAQPKTAQPQQMSLFDWFL
jgi:hypothetical protein